MLARPMRLRCLPFVALPLLVSCEAVRDWRMLQTDPMPIGQAFDGLVYVASGQGFVSDASVTDRGMGIWQSRWKQRILDTRHPGRFRLRAEILVDEGSTTKGWPIRYAIDQQKVGDLRRSVDPREEDWSGAGQDGEREAILGEGLSRRLAPKAALPRADERKAP
jgi:hypothetical protein